MILPLVGHTFSFLLMVISFTILPVSANAMTRLKDDSRDTVIRVDARPDLGFNYPYFLRIPAGVRRGESQFLLVETNNTGLVNDTLLVHEKAAFLASKSNSLGSSLSRELQVPFLVPIFPRPLENWKVYTHALDRDAALIDEGDMQRLDLQLIAMIRDSKFQLTKFNIVVNERVLLNGFSASGAFANRFSMIHPEVVEAVAIGGVSAMLMLPNRFSGDTALDFPLGTHDFSKRFNKEANLEAYKRIPQFIYMGERDHNDAVLFDDGYSNEERNIIFSHLGATMLPTRWNACKAIYESTRVSARFKLYDSIGHETNREVLADVVNFFNGVIGK